LPSVRQSRGHFRCQHQKKGKKTIPYSPQRGREREGIGIYEAYPKKVGKPAALREIAKAIGVHGYDNVMNATRRYAEARKGEDPRFTPHPANWFRQERYNDDPSTWASATGKTNDRLDELNREIARRKSAGLREQQAPGFKKRLEELLAEKRALEGIQP
jgi:hypothetical protein